MKTVNISRRTVCRDLVAGVGALGMATFGTRAFAAKPTVLKLAHQWPAASGEGGDHRSLWADKFAAEVEKQSGGSLKVEVYPGNSLVQPKQQWSALRSGALDMAVIVPSYFTGQAPELEILNMMGVVNSNDAAYEFDRGEGGRLIRKYYESQGIRPIASMWGPETLGLRSKKVMMPEDVKGLKLRGPGPAIEKVFASQGAGIVSIPSSDLYTALQTGVLDGAITTFISIRSFHMYEAMKYVIMSPSDGGMLYANSPIVMSKARWDQLDDEQQEIITKAAKEVEPWVMQATADEATDSAEFFRDKGVEVYNLSEEAFKAWIEAAQPIVDAYAKRSDTAAGIVEAARAMSQ